MCSSVLESVTGLNAQAVLDFLTDSKLDSLCHDHARGSGPDDGNTTDIVEHFYEASDTEWERLHNKDMDDEESSIK